MSLVPYLAVCAAGALLTLLAEPWPRFSRAVGIAALGAALLAAMTIHPGDTLTGGGVRLETTWYAGFFLSAAACSALAACLIGLVAGWPVRLAPAALASFGALGIAMSADAPGTAMLAAAAAATPALLVAMGSGGGGAAAERGTAVDGAAAGPGSGALGVARAEIRTLALLVAGAALAAASAVGANWTGQVGLPIAVAFLLLGVALAIRSGVVPFHAPAAHVSAAAGRLAMPLILIWVPAGLGVMALAWSGATFQFEGGFLDLAAGLLVVLGVLTLLLGALGALLHGELEEVLVYSIVQDAGFLLLALGARRADVAEPARLWLVVFVIAKSAFAVWVAAMATTFGTSRLEELRGWARRAPMLAAALAGIVLATLGWPGSAVYIARIDLAGLAAPGPYGWVGLLALVLALFYYVRLFAVGLAEKGEAAAAASGERLRRPFLVAAAAAVTPPAVPVPAGEAPQASDDLSIALLQLEATLHPDDLKAGSMPRRAGGHAAEDSGAATAAEAPDGSHTASRAAARARTIAAAAAGRLMHVARRTTALLAGAWAGLRRGSRQLATAWTLNRIPAMNALVLALALVATSIAFGGFGSQGAAAVPLALEGAVSSAGLPSSSPSAEMPAASGAADGPAQAPSGAPLDEPSETPGGASPLASPTSSGGATASPTTADSAASAPTTPSSAPSASGAAPSPPSR